MGAALVAAASIQASLLSAQAGILTFTFILIGFPFLKNLQGTQGDLRPQGLMGRIPSILVPSKFVLERPHHPRSHWVSGPPHFTSLPTNQLVGGSQP